MIVKKLIIIPLLFLFICTAYDATAQIRVMNENGEPIILMPDGTWVYDEAELKRMKIKEEKKKKKQVKEAKSPAKEKEIVAKEVKVKELKFKEDKVKTPKVKEPKVEEPVVKTPKVKEPKVEEPVVKTPKVKEPKVKVEEPVVKTPKVKEPKVKEAVVKTPKVKEPKVKEAVVKTPKVKEPKVKVEESVVKTPKVKEPKVKVAEPVVKTAKVKEPKVKEAEPVIKTTKVKEPKVKGGEPVVKTVKVKEPKVKVAEPVVKTAKVKEPKAPKVPKSKKSTVSKQSVKAMKSKMRADIRKAKMQEKTLENNEKTGIGSFNPDNCKYVVNEVDEFTGKRKRVLEDRYFFDYTPESLSQFLKGESYLKCTGFLSEIATTKVLNLAFVIDSPIAQQEYGVIENGARLIIKLLDGETITLFSEKYDPGYIDKITEKTHYSAYYIISPKDEKILRKNEISSIRVVWTTGYEDYNIYELDFLINQFNCFDVLK